MNKIGTFCENSFDEDEFTLEKCIEILDNVEAKFGVKKGKSLKNHEFKLVIATTTGRVDKLFFKDWVESLEEIDCINTSQNKKLITIILDGDDLRWVNKKITK